MIDPFYKDGLRFSCERCSSCCRHDPGYVNLSEQDLEKLAKWVNLDRDAFIERYCRWAEKADEWEYLCLNEKPNYDCIMWDGGCIAYDARPLQCSSYPFWLSLVTDEDWWEAAARDCPGMNKGTLHDREEIDRHLTRRRAEPYIRRKVSEEK